MKNLSTFDKSKRKIWSIVSTIIDFVHEENKDEAANEVFTSSEIKEKHEKDKRF